MPAILQIDQAGLAAGTPGEARTDGTDFGSLVTLTSTGGGTTHSARLLWVPPSDVDAVSSFAVVGPTSWTFTPTVGVYGRYRIELIVDEGLPSEDRQIRTFGIRLPATGLLIPALNEIADPDASLVLAGATQIDRSESNEAFKALQYLGWWPSFERVAEAIEDPSRDTYVLGPDDFMEPTLSGNWDVTGSVGGGTQTILTADAANAAEGIGNVELDSGPGVGDISEMLWGLAAGPSPITGGSRPVFRARVNVIIGTLANFTPEIGLLNQGVSMLAFLGKVGSNWELNLLSPAGGGGGAAVDTGIAIGGAQNISIEVVPALAVVVIIDGVRFSYTNPVNIGRGVERCRPFARVTRDAGAGGVMVVDYIEVRGTRPA